MVIAYLVVLVYIGLASNISSVLPPVDYHQISKDQQHDQKD